MTGSPAAETLFRRATAAQMTGDDANGLQEGERVVKQRHRLRLSFPQSAPPFASSFFSSPSLDGASRSVCAAEVEVGVVSPNDESRKQVQKETLTLVLCMYVCERERKSLIFMPSCQQSL